MRQILAALFLVTVTVGAAPLARAQTQHTERDLSASARASVAQAMYASTATSAAIERAADARISEQRRQIEAMQTRLEQLGGSNAALEAQITVAQERFVQDLVARDRAYAQEIAVFRNALTNIASTPEGARALRRFNSGDEVGALAILDDLRAAHDRARQARSQAELEIDNRRIALLHLETRARTRLGAQYANAGTFLSDAQERTDDEADALILQGDLAGARRRLLSSLAARVRDAANQADNRFLRADVANLHDRIGDVASALGEHISAIEHYRAALALRRDLVASDPEAALLQRAIGVGLYKLARTPNAGVTWAEVASQFETMNALGILAMHDSWALDEFRRRAAAEAESSP